MDTPFTFNDVPSLQNHSQLFITGSLGIPGLVQGPGNQVQEFIRHVAISAPQLALDFDQSTSHYDNIRVAPGTIPTLKFRLVGTDCKIVNLQGMIWS